MKSLLTLSLAALLALLPVNSREYKVAILSDIHLQPFYDPYIDASTYCVNKSISDFLDPPSRSKIYAPLGRILCDSPALIVEGFIKRISELKEPIDYLLLTGDMVGHTLSIELYEEDQPELYAKLKEVHTQVSDYLAYYLPNTVILPTLGNNDYKYHYQSPSESDKQEFYSFFFQQYFKKQPKNTQIQNLGDIQTTLMNGGYYRVDLSENISFLGLNTMMFSIKNQPENQACQQADQFQWLERQFIDAEPGRKFILSNHIYPGTKIENRQLKKLWHSNFTVEFIELLQKYHDKVLIEISGHDHVADLRYNKGSYVEMVDKFLSVEEEQKDYNFHNLLIAPGVTSATAQNPGYTTFTLDNEQTAVKDLQMTFLPIEKTYNNSYVVSDLDSWPWRHLEFKSLGINEITADSIDSLKNRIIEDEAFLWKYLTLKIGYDPEDPVEMQKSISMHINEVGIVDDDNNTYMYKCQMFNSLGHDDFLDCMEKTQPTEKNDRKVLKKKH
eukprot:403346462